jgi:hypothetical protein
MNMNNIRKFFEPSDFMEHEVLRPLSHIRANWELQIDSETGRYLEEEDSFAALFNALIDELATTQPPLRYHDNEDRLGEHVQKHLNWKIRKSGSTWVNQDGARLHPSDYLALLEQGGYDNRGINNLVIAASGRVHVLPFDEARCTSTIWSVHTRLFWLASSQLSSIIENPTKR